MKDKFDPTGVIAEAFRIENISASECRSIFFDWALGVPSDAETRTWVQTLLTRHEGEGQDHPMIQTLTAALQQAAPPIRKGGRAGRLKQQ